VLLGGAVWFFPNLFLVYQVFTKVGTANTIVRRFYRAEFTKLFLSAVLFIFAIKFFSVNMLAFLLGFSSAQLMFWVTPLVKTGMLRL
jgi:F0F1-type ATP synthase assembly protein I